MELKENQQYIQILIQTLKNQKDILSQVLAVTKRQSVIADIENFNEEDFEQTLNEKEVLIAKLNEIDNGFVSVYGHVRVEIKNNPKLYSEELKEIQSLIKDCTDLSVEIKVVEERNREKLVKCFSAKNKQYGMQQNAATVASKYHQTMNSGRMNGSNFSL